MTNSAELPVELSFLGVYIETKGPHYRSAWWLVSDFDALVWIIDVANQLSVDWRIRLGSSGSLLTASQHSDLLEAFKSWIVVQTHVDWTARLISAPKTDLAAIRRALHCVDYLLLRADALGLAEHGLQAITKNDVKAILAEIGSNFAISTSIYQWPQRLTSFLRRQGASLSDQEFQSLIDDTPFLAQDIPDTEDRTTELTDQEVIRARAWLWRENGYLSLQTGNGYKYHANTSVLADTIYSDTLCGARVQHPVPLELGLLPTHFFVTEFPRANVKSVGDERMSCQSLDRFFWTFSSLSLLQQEGLRVPALRQEDMAAVKLGLDLKGIGRFRTLPQHVVFPALRSAIEFGLTYGNALVDSYLNVARAAHQAGQGAGAFTHENGIRQFLHPDVIKLGVKGWAIEWNMMSGLMPNAPQRLTLPDFYGQLRANTGLWECLRVFYGATQVVVGTLMARRHGALIDLVAGSSLDVTRKFLVFLNRKSGIGGLRNKMARPIPSVAVELIEMLERLQTGLIEIGALAGPTNLFAYPKNRGDESLCRLTTAGYNESLNYFCDWIQTPLDSEERRYYIRQHQLRRFFCMLFFWGGSFGGLETLRWFLGQTDPAHIWNYITESTPGLAVRSVAAQWATYGVQHGAPEAQALGAVLKEHFGTSNFDVLDADVLQNYIEDLMAEGRLSIEPEFLDNGKQYRIAVVLRPTEAV